MTKDIETYFTDGCGRCSLFGTPQCKVHLWTEPMKILRSILLDCGLTEEMKWGQPTYTYKNKNVIILAAFKEFCSLNFFKGALLADTENLLEKPGENSQSARYLKFTQAKDVQKKKDIIKAYIFETIEIENAGLKVETKKNPEPVPEELKARLKKDATYKKYFEALTPGRKRSYYIYIAQAKQAKTREDRVEKCFAKIKQGKGWNEY